jgi:hypothetical protein
MSGGTRSRIAKAEPLPPAPVTEAASEPSAATTRDELLAKLRAKRVEKRQGRSSKQVISKTSEKAMTSVVQGLQTRMQNGTMSKDEQARFKEFENILEGCGNDMKLACRQYGVREDIIEDVVKASQLIESSTDNPVGKAVGNVMSALRNKNILPGTAVTRKK